METDKTLKEELAKGSEDEEDSYSEDLGSDGKRRRTSDSLGVIGAVGGSTARGRFGNHRKQSRSRSSLRQKLWCLIHV